MSGVPRDNVMTIRRLIVCAVLFAAACGPNGTTDDPAFRLHQARSLRCTFRAEAARLSRQIEVSRLIPIK
jgi:hypothetical protein